MRRLSVEVIAKDGGIHPIDKAFTTATDIRREAIDYLNYLNDRTGVMMYLLRGEQERIEEILDESDDIHSYNIFTAGNSYQVYIHFKVEGIAHELLQLVNNYEVVVDFPVKCTKQGLQVTIIGEQADFISILDELPDHIEVRFLSLTTYTDTTPERSLLTSRQREILELAVTEGYYDQPRGITREEIAEKLGVSGSTVSEHLQKAENRVLTDYLR